MPTKTFIILDITGNLVHYYYIGIIANMLLMSQVKSINNL